MAGWHQKLAKGLTHEPRQRALGLAQLATPFLPSLPQRGKQMPVPPQVGVGSAHPPSWLAAPQESALELS